MKALLAAEGRLKGINEEQLDKFVMVERWRKASLCNQDHNKDENGDWDDDDDEDKDDGDDYEDFDEDDDKDEEYGNSEEEGSLAARLANLNQILIFRLSGR